VEKVSNQENLLPSPPALSLPSCPAFKGAKGGEREGGRREEGGCYCTHLHVLLVKGEKKIKIKQRGDR